MLPSSKAIIASGISSGVCEVISRRWLIRGALVLAACLSFATTSAERHHMPRAQLLVASNCTCYQHLEDDLHRSSADSCDVGFSRWECWEPFLISVTNVGIGLRWFSAGPLYGAVLMAQSAALNFILVRDAQCARHHIARSDQNDTECVPCAKKQIPILSDL